MSPSLAEIGGMRELYILDKPKSVSLQIKGHESYTQEIESMQEKMTFLVS
jgi:hypothetical protein